LTSKAPGIAGAGVGGLFVSLKQAVNWPSTRQINPTRVAVRIFLISLFGRAGAADSDGTAVLVLLVAPWPTTVRHGRPAAAFLLGTIAQRILASR
jgi:hypothetical protein